MLPNQLKALLHKEKENIDFKQRVKSAISEKNSVQGAYNEITKKLSEDNTLTKKIKQYELQISSKIDKINKITNQLEKFQENTEKARRSSKKNDIDLLNARIELLNNERTQFLNTIKQLRRELEEIEENIKNPLRNPAENAKEPSRDEIKAIEIQIVEKEKEQKILFKQKKDLLSDSFKSPKEISNKRKSNQSSFTSAVDAKNSDTVTTESKERLRRKNNLQLVSVLGTEDSDEKIFKTIITPKITIFDSENSINNTDFQRKFVFSTPK